MRDLQVSVRERRRPRPERAFGELAVSGYQVRRQQAVCHEPLALVVELATSAMMLRVPQSPRPRALLVDWEIRQAEQARVLRNIRRRRAQAVR